MPERAFGARLQCGGFVPILHPVQPTDFDGKLMTSPVPVPMDLAQQIDRALAEDIGSGDLTAALIPSSARSEASVITREKAVVCGIPYVDGVFARLDPAVHIDWQVSEGATAVANQTL